MNSKFPTEFVCDRTTKRDSFQYRLADKFKMFSVKLLKLTFLFTRISLYVKYFQIYIYTYVSLVVPLLYGPPLGSTTRKAVRSVKETLIPFFRLWISVAINCVSFSHLPEPKTETRSILFIEVELCHFRSRSGRDRATVVASSWLLSLVNGLRLAFASHEGLSNKRSLSTHDTDREERSIERNLYEIFDRVTIIIFDWNHTGNEHMQWIEAVYMGTWRKVYIYRHIEDFREPIFWQIMASRRYVMDNTLSGLKNN